MSVCVECRIQNNTAHRERERYLDICDKSSCYPTFSSKMRLPTRPVDQKISDKVTILGGYNPIIGLMADSKDGDWWTGTLREEHCGNSGAQISKYLLDIRNSFQCHRKMFYHLPDRAQTTFHCTRTIMLCSVLLALH